MQSYGRELTKFDSSLSKNRRSLHEKSIMLYLVAGSSFECAYLKIHSVTLTVHYLGDANLGDLDTTCQTRTADHD